MSNTENTNSEPTYFAVYGQGVIWGTGHSYDEAVSDADKWVNQDNRDDEPTIYDLLEQAQGHRFGDGWSVLHCSEAAYKEIQANGGQIDFTIEDDVIVLPNEVNGGE